MSSPFRASIGSVHNNGGPADINIAQILLKVFNKNLTVLWVIGLDLLMYQGSVGFVLCMDTVFPKKSFQQGSGS